MKILRGATLAVLLSSTAWIAGCAPADGVPGPASHAATQGAARPAAASRTASSTAVAAKERMSAEEAKAEAALAIIPAYEPQKLGSIRIGGDVPDPTRPPIDEASEFAIDDRGRFGFMPGCGCEHGKKLLLVDRNGALLKTIDLAGMKEGLSRNVAWLRGDRWVMTTSENKVGGTTSAAWLDVASGSVTPIEGFASAPVKALAAARDGGFVALTTTTGMFNSGSAIAAFDADGKPRWKVGGVFNSIAVAATGEVVAYRESDKHLLVYGPDGRSLHDIDLRKSLGDFGGFSIEVRADRSGGIVLAALPTEHPVARLRLDGSVVAQIATKYADARGFMPRNDVEFDSEGRMWAHDGHAFVRLDATGKVDRIVGEKFDPDRLGNIDTVAVDTAGRIYAVDSWTDSVHVFDDAGQRLRVDRPERSDYMTQVASPWVTVATSGDAYVTRHESDYGNDNGKQADFLHYSPLGQRVGIETVKTEAGSAARWLVQPDGQHRWVFDFDRILLVDAHGAVLRKIDKAGNGSTGGINAAAVAADGSLAVVGVVFRQGFLPWDTSATTSTVLLSPRGDVIAAWPAPTDFEGMQNIAYDGRRVVFVVPGGKDGNASIVVTNTKGKPQFRFPIASDAWRTRVFLVQRATGSELWIFNGERTIDRYALTH
ncbi:MAG TPA: hypothetical protein VGH80_00440 [Xanthomonadaceae bacterium]|jgi:hypothetical protein